MVSSNKKKSAPTKGDTGEAAPSSTACSGGSGSHNVCQQRRSIPGRTTGPARRSSKGNWTPEEDEILSRAVHQFQGKNWKKIAEFLPGRDKVQCSHRWQKVLNPELVKGSWSKEEDGIIVEMVHKYGTKKWSKIAQALPGHIGKQCRERWHNHLNPSIKKEAWTQEEEIMLINAHAMLGNKWVELTKYLPGRCENSIKNHWNCSVKNKVNLHASMGLLEHPPPLPLPLALPLPLPSIENTLHPPVQEIPNSNNPSSSCLNPPQGSRGRGVLFSPSMAMSSRPFISCDYVNSGDVLQEEYSPLGIRQWITSSDLYSPDSSEVWCMQSVSSEKESRPEELLKSAAKTKSFNSKRRRGMLSSPLQDKRGNALHTKGTELEIDTTALQDNPPEKENIPPESGSKTSPINIPDGATEASGGGSDSDGISRTLKKRKRKNIPGSSSRGTNSNAIKELQLFADALLAEDPDFFREDSVLIENFQDQRWFSPAKLLKKN